MENELIEKCRLTDEEIEDIKNQVELIGYHYTQSYVEEVIKRVRDAQLAKAIPLISAEARKQERKAIQDLYQTISGDIVIPKDDWKVGGKDVSR